MNSIRNLDARVALALSGEFRAPTDPVKNRMHNLAFLLMATLEKGEVDENSSTATYLPSWAPVVSASRFSGDRPVEFSIAKIDDPDTKLSFFQLGYTLPWRGPTKSVSRPAISYRPIIFATQIYEIGTVEGCAKARAEVAQEAGLFFSALKEWNKDGDVWVPPIPKTDEQVAVSEL